MSSTISDAIHSAQSYRLGVVLHQLMQRCCTAAILILEDLLLTNPEEGTPAGSEGTESGEEAPNPRPQT
jgi:hypothetical protein